MLDTCTNVALTTIYPLGICLDGVIYSRGAPTSTSETLVSTIYISLDCSSGPLVPRNLTLASTCASFSTTSPAGVLTTVFDDAICSMSSSQTGMLAGVCYQPTAGGSAMFQSCGNNTATMLTFSATTNCTGVSNSSTITVDPTCNYITTNGLYSSMQCVAPAATTSPSSSSPMTCFAGSEMVLLESGASIPLSEVKVGDRVLSANTMGKVRFSSVVSVPHGANQMSAIFLHLQLVNGMDLKLTAEHLLMGGSCADSALTLKTAASLHVGDCVHTVSGQEKISAIQEVQGKGLYSVVTEEELIVVNGVLASPFAVNHAVPHAFYHIHRILFWMAPALVKSAGFAEAHRVFSALFMEASF